MSVNHAIVDALASVLKKHNIYQRILASDLECSPATICSYLAKKPRAKGWAHIDEKVALWLLSYIPRAEVIDMLKREDEAKEDKGNETSESSDEEIAETPRSTTPETIYQSQYYNHHDDMESYYLSKYMTEYDYQTNYLRNQGNTNYYYDQSTFINPCCQYYQNNQYYDLAYQAQDRYWNQ